MLHLRFCRKVHFLHKCNYIPLTPTIMLINVHSTTAELPAVLQIKNKTRFLFPLNNLRLKTLSPETSLRELPGFPGIAAVSANAECFLSKGVLGAPASRWQQFWKTRVLGKQLYVINDDGVSVFGWAGEPPALPGKRSFCSH